MEGRAGWWQPQPAVHPLDDGQAGAPARGRPAPAAAGRADQGRCAVLSAGGSCSLADCRDSHGPLPLPACQEFCSSPNTGWHDHDL